MRRLYEPAAYDTGRWPDSHWRATAPAAPRHAPLQGAARAEVAVVGAGYAGLNAALVLAARGIDVAVLDAGQPGWGASGRNGGFCCIGGTKLPDAEIARRHGIDEARALRRFQIGAVEHVAGLLETHGIDAERGPPGEICIAHSPRAWAELRAEVEERNRLMGEALRLIPREELAQEGLGCAVAHGASYDPTGFPLHPMRYVLGLVEAARSAGVRLYGDSAVTGLAPADGGWRLATPGGEVRARKVLVATNGYSSEDLPPWLSGRTLPALSTILVTRPLTGDERRAQGWTGQRMAYDSRSLLHYFRLLRDGRFLFGMRGGLSAAPAAEARIRAEARRHFEIMFPAWSRVETEREWSGLVCLTGSLTPYVGPVPGAEGLFAALGWHGNGVSTASFGGQAAGRMIAGEPGRLPAPLAAPPRRFPLAPFRRNLLALAYLWRGWKDGPLRAAAPGG
jgi:glycine/D-amino acid oxidase-like deaminating enzyme